MMRLWLDGCIGDQRLIGHIALAGLGRPRVHRAITVVVWIIRTLILVHEQYIRTIVEIVGRRLLGAGRWVS